MATEVYKRTVTGSVPLTVEAFKDHIHLPQQMSSQDSVIVSMISTATLWGERYTRREFRENTWTLTLDCFPTFILLRRDPVVSITSITYLVDGVVTTVDSATYYLRKDVQTSQILLVDGSSWPSDGDEITKNRLGSIVVTFESEAYSCENDIPQAVAKHAAHLWSERGDCDTTAAAKASGAVDIYNAFRIVRV
jgi:uncharacterized phiE125 gp8 family phage protein